MNQNDTLAQAYLFFQHGKFDAAYALLQALAQSNGADINVLHLAASAAAGMGLHTESIGLFRRALEAAPGDLAISYKLARVLIDAGRREDALSVYLQLIADGVRHHDVSIAAAVLLQAFNRDEEALHSVQLALQLRPQVADSWHLQAVLLTRLQRLQDAVQCLQQAISLASGHAPYHFDLALALLELQRDAEALAAIDDALVLESRAVAFWNCRATILSRLSRYQESMACSRKALELAPTDADARVNLALALLTQGQLECAWPLYEARWQGELADPARHQQIARWTGSAALRGKTILLWAEQGFGDTLQFCRYALQVAALGAQVVLEVPAELTCLLHSLSDAAPIVVKTIGADLPVVDYQISLLSLPLAFGTCLETIPAQPFYLISEVQKRVYWNQMLTYDLSGRKLPGSGQGLRIGIVCSGNAKNRKDARRSIPLAAFAPLLDIRQTSDVDFYVLQPELRQADRAFLQTVPTLHWCGRQLRAFDDTAALIANLDLVISVDTAVAHLAGALGAPVWILLPVVADWRWFLARSDSPWYPSVRLFRQAEQGEWEELINRVRLTLALTLAANVKTGSNQ